MPMEFPQQFGKYTLLRRLATGGMAEIFLARQGGMGGFEKEVVVKRLLPAYATQEDRVQMFLEEGRIAASLTHPNIAQVFDLGREGDDYYIAMEYVHGVDLRRVCSQGIAEGNYLPLQHAVRIIAEVLDALHYAHTRVDKEGRSLGIVHQDVTPTNILITFDGGVKLVDFGVARSASSPEEITSIILGKAGYMSPEQVVKAPVDARADVFAAGINLYEITVGRRLFRGEDGEETLAVVERCEVPPPKSVNPDFPDRLERVILRALARDPQSRYPDARAMQIALEDFLAGEGLRATAGMLANYIQGLFREALELERTRDSSTEGVVNLFEVSSATVATVMPTSSEPAGGLPGMGPSPAPAGFPQDNTQLSTVPEALLQAAPDPEVTPLPPPEEVPAAEEARTEVVSAIHVPDVPPVTQATPMASEENARTQGVQMPVMEERLPDPEPMPAPADEAPTATVMGGGRLPSSPVTQQTPSPEIPLIQTPQPDPQAFPAPFKPAEQPRTTEPMASAPAPSQSQPSAEPQTRPTPMGPMEIPSQQGVKGSGEDARLSASALLMPPDLTAASDAEKRSPAQSEPPTSDRSLSMSLRVRRSYAGLLILLLVAGGGYGLYYLMTRDQGPQGVKTGALFERPKLGQGAGEVAPTAPPLKRAILRITSEPLGARVVVNGNLLEGKTPTSVETFAGKPSTVRVLLAGFLPGEKRVEVEEAGTDVDFKLEKGLPAFGALKIETAPEEVEISINGNKVGKTPKSFPRVAARTDIALKLEKFGFYTQHVIFNVNEKESRNVAIRMVPDAGPRALSTINVETIPSGALIYDITKSGEKKLLGQTGRESLRVSSKPDAPLRLRAELEGYDPAEWDLDVKESHYTVYIRMTAPTRFYGKLSIKPKRRKQKLTVYVGNTEIGKTPVVDHPLAEGEHTLVIFDEETRVRSEFKVTIAKDEQLVKTVELGDDGKIVIE